jgi:hypothetical protein
LCSLGRFLLFICQYSVLGLFLFVSLQGLYPSLNREVIPWGFLLFHACSDLLPFTL